MSKKLFETSLSGINVISDIELVGDQPERVVNLVYSDLRFDHRGGFQPRLRGPEAPVLNLKTIHFLAQELPDVPDGETKIDGLDDHRFATSPYIYLEDTDGGLTGWRGACEAIRSQWFYGIALCDEEGQVWLFGNDTPTGNPIGEAGNFEGRLIKISTETTSFVERENGFLLENLPAEGEFNISDEDVPVVTSIPWWSNYNPEDTHVKPEVTAYMRETLEHIRGLIESEKASSSPTP